MSEKKNSTVEELKNYLKSNLSETRYKHVLGVAETTEKILEYYKCTNYVKKWNGISAGIFCGLAHDISRELEPEKWIEICDENNVDYYDDERQLPVLLHGYVSAIMIKNMFDGVPDSWLRAISIHTLGDSNMDDLALALFAADYLEPNRTYLSDEQRKAYFRSQTIQQCAYTVLCDNMKHQESKGSTVQKRSLRMKAFLENK